MTEFPSAVIQRPANRKRAMVLLSINKKVREGYGRTVYDYDLLDLVEDKG